MSADLVIIKAPRWKSILRTLLAKLRNLFSGRRSKPKPAAETGDEVLRLVPFDDVLLEEYEMQTLPEKARAERQAEREKLKKSRGTTDASEDPDARAKREAGETAKAARNFFTRLVIEQRKAADAKFTRLVEQYKKSDPALAERAAVDHTFGFLGDEYERQRRKKEDSSEGAAGGVNSTQEMSPEAARKRREEQLKKAAFEEWRRSRGGKPPATGGPQGGQESHGRTPPGGGSGGGGGGGGEEGGSEGGGGGSLLSGGGITLGGSAGSEPSGGGSTAPGNGAGGGGKVRTPREAKQALARAERSALCLSGGGIRSATFNLGILQGLARHGLLGQFDYLSTVSGGGFIGGWLTAWLHRQNDPALRDPDPPGEVPPPASDVERVVAQLKCKPPSPLEPEPLPIKHLRIFSNYLSPQPGLLSVDTWTLISTLLRNLLLTWLVFVPFLVLMLMLPRAWARVIGSDMWAHTNNLEWVGMGSAWVALGFVGLALAWPRSLWPRKKRGPAAGPATYRSRELLFLVCCLLPVVVAAVAIACYWKGLSQLSSGDLSNSYGLGDFVWFAVLLLLVPWIVTNLVRFFLSVFWQEARLTAQRKKREVFFRFLFATIVLALAQVVTGCLLFVLTKEPYALIGGDGLAYATLSVPIIMAALALDCVLIAGFTSTLAEDEDMEWWARGVAWLLIVVVGWAVIHALVLFGPDLVLTLGRTLGEARREGFWTGETLKAAGQAVAVLGGVASLVVTLAGGFSSKTPAHGADAASHGVSSRLLGALAGLLGPLALAFLLILIALGTNYLLRGAGLLLDRWRGDWVGGLGWLRSGVADFNGLSNFSHAELVASTTLPLLLLTAAAVGLVGLTMGLLINSNKFSLHYLWRNRIIRAYLGASNRKRSPDSFTNFDPLDDIPMHELRTAPPPGAAADGGGEGGRGDEKRVHNLNEVRAEEAPLLRRKLFHVLNIALNLAGGNNLAWQDRKSESFTVSPLHCGSYWLGYRRSSVYGGEGGVTPGGKGGITLGTAVAISGAFVSPNMGYMMTSPVVRFLMTLFNVRFGWWLGNPGPVGDSTPLLERVTAIVRKRLGRISAHPFESASPALSVIPIVTEAFGKTDDTSPYVYLSDGGHFENLGLYEMVLRRCRFIVVSDASTDAGYSFDSLAQSIRQVRVDFGIPIDITDMSIIPPSDDMRGKYCAVGTIRYSCVDRDTSDPEHEGLTDEDFDGTLVYIKASMIGEEPRDVVNYGRGSRSFPQEIIVDQWFSEAQFESYRALGSHIIDSLCGVGVGHASDRNPVELPEFEDKARRHNQLNFAVFKERASYAALENEFRRIMRRDTPGEYSERVREYFKNLVG